MNKNNKIFTIAVLTFATFIFANCQNKNQNGTKNTEIIDSTGTSVSADRLPIAYINIDSLLQHYLFAKDAREELTKEYESSQATINSRARQLQQDAAEFQRKLDNSAFLSRERAEEEGARLQKRDQELQELSTKLQEKFIEKQQTLDQQYRDTLSSFLKEFNKDKKYEMILSNTSNTTILWADPAYDITAEVIEALNKRMKK